MWFSIVFFFFFKQKTAYELLISDWSSDVCSSDLCWPDRKEMENACDGIRKSDRGQRKGPAADRGNDRNVRGDGQVQRGAGQCRGDGRRRRAQALIRRQAHRL